MTYFCAPCLVNWWPYQTNGGACPVCGGGTVRRNEGVSPDATERFIGARAERARRARAAAFEEFYVEREMRLNGLHGLPVAETHRYLAPLRGRR